MTKSVNSSCSHGDHGFQVVTRRSIPWPFWPKRNGCRFSEGRQALFALKFRRRKKIKAGGSGRVDVAAWLQSLGLEHFEPVFRQNAIGADVLPELRDEHL
ncbi:MAG: SAM domain-containing protein, partial [Rhodoplanes sp.]